MLAVRRNKVHSRMLVLLVALVAGCTSMTPKEKKAERALLREKEQARQERLYGPRIFDRDSLPGPGPD